MIPDFTDGVLPPGIHVARWDEVPDRFGWTPRRQRLIVGLRACLLELARVGCARAWLDGSFVTAKDLPGDFDLAWDPAGVSIRALDPVLLDLDAPRRSQKVKYGGDILPNVTESNSGMPFLDFFQQDAATGKLKGIVELDPGDVQ